MSELTLLVLRIGFLVLLWAFVFAVVYALRSDLFGQRPRRMKSDAGPAPSAPAASPFPRQQAPQAAPTLSPDLFGGSGPATRLVITSGNRAGADLELPREPLTIGRSADSTLVIRDDYTSTHHARLERVGDDWIIHDLRSTNGTFVDGRRVEGSQRVDPDTPVRIGTTTFELRR